MLDFIIYLAQWGITDDDMKWVCESNHDGMIYTACNSYKQAVFWCESKGYTHN